MTKIAIGAVVAFLVGAGCRYFGIPVPSPPVLPGALLVVAMTLGYSGTDRMLQQAAARQAGRQERMPTMAAQAWLSTANQNQRRRKEQR